MWMSITHYSFESGWVVGLGLSSLYSNSCSKKVYTQINNLDRNIFILKKKRFYKDVIM